MLCAGPLPIESFEAPRFSVPPEACDTHAHVVANRREYPLVENRSYTAAEATEADYLAMLDATHITRGVLVQISVHGTDNRLMLNTLAKHPGRLRGVAVVGPDVDERELSRMHRLGVRGLRLNVLFRGGVGLAAMGDLADKIATFGWHLQLLLDARQLPELKAQIERLPVPVVVDHMGHMPSKLGIEHPAFQALLSLMRNGRTWVKLSGAYRIDSGGPEYLGATRLAQALVDAAPDQLLYGSDWPHVGLSRDAMPNTGRMLNLIGEWVTDDALRQKILVKNPARLYQF